MKPKDERYEVVSLPIPVPKGDFCWNIKNHAICNYFDACGDNAKCYINLGNLEYDTNGGVEKPERCKQLK